MYYEQYKHYKHIAGGINENNNRNKPKRRDRKNLYYYEFRCSLGLFWASLLKKSKRTVSRYIKKGWLNPEKIKGQKGFEYRFSQSEIESFKKPDTTGQTTRQVK